MNDFSMDPDDVDVLAHRVGSGHVGEEVAFADNVNPSYEHLHLTRLGDVGDRLAGRVSVMAHSGSERVVTLIFSAPEARMIAAALLNLADELDGETPLAFFPRGEDE